MKKAISVILATLMLFSLSVCAFAWDTSKPINGMDKEALNELFVYGEGPYVEGYAIDYRYYSPVKENDENKYPLVVWLHGMGNGMKDGDQLGGNDIGFWASEQFQSRFVGGGAFILAARSPEEQINFWGTDTIYPLRAALDDFIAKNADNLDISRIYIGGFSMGGKMTLNMTYAYPDMFAAAFPICPAGKISKDNAPAVADIPYWFVSGKKDPLVNYDTGVKPTWENVISATNHPADCRFSTLSEVRNPDGSRTETAHSSWFAVTFDMFSVDNGDYPYMSTVNGLGESVTLTYPNGMIYWLSQFESSFDGAVAEDAGNFGKPARSVFNLIYSFFERIFNMIRSAFEGMFA